MRLPKFDSVCPRTLGEACEFLGGHKGEARVMAGGTDFLVAMKQRRATPRYLLNLKGIADLNGITYDPATGASIGALVTLDDIAGSAEIAELYPSLSQAAQRAAAPQIRNVGTIGGNIALDSRCWYYNQSEFWRSARQPCFKAGGEVCYVVKGGKQCYSLISADTVPALMSLGASVDLVSSAGTRVVPVENLYTGLGQNPNRMEPGEILKRVTLPNPTRRGVYLKCAQREAIDFPLVGVAVALSLSGGTIKDVRICVGAASPAPVRAIKAEAILSGQALSDELLAEAGRATAGEVTPIVNIYAPVAYKRRMVEVFTKRAIVQAMGQA